jgi:hypothetical protein
MEKVPVDKDLVAKLSALKDEAILCDEQGRTLGYFSPAEAPMSLEEVIRTAPRSLEEIEEQMKKYAGKRPEEIGKPLHEILARLGLR